MRQGRTKAHLDTNKGLLNAEGITENGDGDTQALLTAIAVNSSLVIGWAVVFSFLRKAFPNMYMNKPLQEPDTTPPASTKLLGWIQDSFRLTFDQIYLASTLDAALFVEFNYLAMKLLIIIGLPACLCLVPLHYFYGTPAPGIGPGSLDLLSLNNVPDGHWLFIVHAVFVWFVVVAAEKMVYDAMDKFMQLRKVWLKSMPKPRSSTVMVDSIPIQFRNDQALKDHFEDIIGEGKVARSYIVRHTEHLLELQKDAAYFEHELHKAETVWERKGKDERDRPSHVDTRYTLGQRVDSIDYYRRMKESSEQRVAIERDRVRQCAEAGDLSVLSSSAFVTLRHRRDAEVLLSLKLSVDDDELKMFYPPDPQDVLYQDLLMDKRRTMILQAVGYCLITALFFTLLPLIVCLTRAMDLNTIRREVPFIGKLIDKYRWIIPVWNGVMRTAALNIIMSYLPAVLAFILTGFFRLKSSAYLQGRMTRYYFYFQVVFVLLITAISDSLLETVKILSATPSEAVYMLAESLPLASNFYLSYLTIIWTSHIFELLRMGPMMRFLTFRAVCSSERARTLAEPEDQMLFGIGCRSCRLSIQLLIGLTFCTIMPLITVICFVNFAICRLTYAYLFVYAEGRKTDVGGDYFVQQLHNLQEGLIIFIFVTTGITLDRASSGYVGVANALALLYQVFSYNRFYHRFHWHTMPLMDLKHDHTYDKRPPSRRTYDQPELHDPDLDLPGSHENTPKQPQAGQQPQASPTVGSVFRASCC